MIRVVYEWQVEAAGIAAFREAWQQVTARIHETVPGARGSLLIQQVDDPGRILTVARWDSLEDWQAFWQAENPPQMVRLRELGQRLSATAYDEYADFTV